MSDIVSIIIPALNEEKNIERILKSIQNQSYKNIEAIVVDDGSSDRTAKIAQQYTNHVYERKHAERSVQRNFGAKKAKGKYLIFLDADMELSKNVVKQCIELSKNNVKALVIPEKTTGEGFFARIKKFEREMYMGDLNVEVARFFEKKVFEEVGGYDPKLTGPEDYDLPYRVSKKYPLGRISAYIYHHEANVPLTKLLRKKYYYARHGAYYAQKHPELVLRQGVLIFRMAYLRNWKKLVAHPLLTISFFVVRLLETIAAFLGYFRAVGLKGVFLTISRAIKSK